MTARKFSQQELEKAADRAVAEFERETAQAQLKGVSCNPHTLFKGKWLLHLFFEYEVSRNGMRKLESWRADHELCSNAETKRAFSYAFNAGLEVLGSGMPERPSRMLKAPDGFKVA